MEVGESLYEKIRQFESGEYSLLLVDDTEVVDDTETKFPLGHKFVINNSLKEQAKRVQHPFTWSKQRMKAMCADTGFRDSSDKTHTVCLVDTEDKGYFTKAAYGTRDVLYPLSNNAAYKITAVPPSYDKDSFRYVALYQGKIDNKIKISFREFKDDMVRPAFTQDIEYELNKNGDTVVGFKGLRIKVIKATNTDITYSVIQDYN